MKFFLILFTAACALAQSLAPVEIELMTYPEIRDAIQRQGKTTALILNGGTEQRGPHAVLGGHSLIARRAGGDIARRLGNALLAPAMPFSPADNHLNRNWPGTVTIPMEAYMKVNEAVVASLAVAGFKNIVLMGEHGGGQRDLEDLAKLLDASYRSQGTRVHFCGAIYRAYGESNDWLKQNNLPTGRHAFITDTSLLMYLGGADYVRKDKIGPAAKGNGIDGDPRPSTPEIGKKLYEMKISAAVEEIKRLTALKP